MKDYSEGERKNLFLYVDYPRENLPDGINWGEFNGKRAEEDTKKFNKSNLGKMVLNSKP